MTRRPRLAYAAYPLAVLMGASTLVTPLYDAYRRAFSFSPLTLTLVFSVYLLVMVPALLVLGPLGDVLGRKPLLVASVVFAAGATALFLLADGIAWLFAARVATALAVASGSGVAAAALVELAAEPQRGALAASVSLASGSAVAPLLGGALAEVAPWPLRTPFAVYLGALALAGAALVRLPEPLPPERRRRYRPPRPTLPPARRVFLLAAGVLSFAWGVNGLILGLVSTYLRELLHTSSVALAGATAALLLGSGALAQLVLLRGRPRRAVVVGLLLVVAGLASTIAAAPARSAPLLVLGAVVHGVGQGIAFRGSLAIAAAAAPPERRADALSTYYAIVYVVGGVTAVGLGVLATVFSFFTGVCAFGALMGACCLALAWLTARTPLPRAVRLAAGGRSAAAARAAVADAAAAAAAREEGASAGGA